VATFGALCYVCVNFCSDCIGREALALHVHGCMQGWYSGSAHVRCPAVFTLATDTSSSTAWAQQVPAVLAHSIVCNHHSCVQLRMEITCAAWGWFYVGLGGAQSTRAESKAACFVPLLAVLLRCLVRLRMTSQRVLVLAGTAQTAARASTQQGDVWMLLAVLCGQAICTCISVCLYVFACCTCPCQMKGITQYHLLRCLSALLWRSVQGVSRAAMASECSLRAAWFLSAGARRQQALCWFTAYAACLVFFGLNVTSSLGVMQGGMVFA
jgi:hypothetical protein